MRQCQPSSTVNEGHKLNLTETWDYENTGSVQFWPIIHPESFDIHSLRNFQIVSSIEEYENSVRQKSQERLPRYQKPWLGRPFMSRTKMLGCWYLDGIVYLTWSEHGSLWVALSWQAPRCCWHSPCQLEWIFLPWVVAPRYGKATIQPLSINNAGSVSLLASYALDPFSAWLTQMAKWSNERTRKTTKIDRWYSEGRSHSLIPGDSVVLYGELCPRVSVDWRKARWTLLYTTYSHIKN